MSWWGRVFFGGIDAFWVKFPIPKDSIIWADKWVIIFFPLIRIERSSFTRAKICRHNFLVEWDRKKFLRHFLWLVSGTPPHPFHLRKFKSHWSQPWSRMTDLEKHRWLTGGLGLGQTTKRGAPHAETGWFFEREPWVRIMKWNFHKVACKRRLCLTILQIFQWKVLDIWRLRPDTRSSP